MTKWKWLAVCLLLAVLFAVCAHVLAGGNTVPTLFHNDEAWYKDSVAPLRMKDEKYHVPADILSMFSDITVTYHNNDDNLLVTHEDGRYVSLLFGSRSAVVNGEIREEISIFRENGYTYVEAAWIAGIFDLTCTDLRLESGQNVLRLADTDTGRTLEELAARYSAETVPEEETETQETAEIPESVPQGDGRKRIYIVTGDNYENTSNYPAEIVIENSGLVCTMFLHSRSDPEKIWQYGTAGIAGICADSAEEADAFNEMLESMCYRRLEVVLPAYEDTDREALRQAGYYVIEPDFVVDYATDPDAVYEALFDYMLDHDTAVVKVSGDGCSQRMIGLMCNLTADPEWCIADVLLP